MNCSDVRPILLAADSAHPADQAAEVRAHLDVCKECCKFTEQLFRLEREWRTLPMPAGSDDAKRAFLRRLAGDLARPRDVAASFQLAEGPRRRSASWKRVAASIAAVAILVAVSVVAWRMLPVGNHEVVAPEIAKTNLIDEIFDWNVALAEANETDRADLLKERPKFEARLQHMSFTADDRQLAETLLDKATLLAENSDPLVAAEHFNAVADQVQQRLELAMVSNKKGEAELWARRLGNIDERGVKPQLDKMHKKGSKSLEKIVTHDAHRKQALQKMLDESPEPTRAAVHRSLKKGSRKN